jgi:monoamine oxidase
VVTAPLGVLKSGSITFSPHPLPTWKRAAIQRLGFGNFEKVVMRFPEPYWATEHAHIFHLSHPNAMDFPLIVDYFYLEKVPILVAFNTGSHAIALRGKSDQEITSHMLSVLRKVQGGPIPSPTQQFVTRWGNDPFTRGSYSYIKIGSTPADQNALAAPVAGRVLFAGEASSTDRYGYADGALSTGIREAKRLLRAGSVQLRAYRSPIVGLASGAAAR